MVAVVEACLTGEDGGDWYLLNHRLDIQRLLAVNSQAHELAEPGWQQQPYLLEGQEVRQLRLSGWRWPSDDQLETSMRDIRPQ